MSYGPFVPAYALLARLYSGGAIPACHRWAVDQLGPGERVLFAGSGPGTDVVRAARAGLQVTAVDNCPAMLASARQRVRAAGVGSRVRLIEADVLTLPSGQDFDAVIAQFFLNVFAPAALSDVLAALAGQLKDSGQLLVGDFCSVPEQGRMMHQLWHGVPMRVFACTGANAVHPVHDLPRHLTDADFHIHKRQSFRLFGAGPPWVQGLVASRQGPAPCPA